MMAKLAISSIRVKSWFSQMVKMGQNQYDIYCAIYNCLQTVESQKNQVSSEKIKQSITLKYK